MLCLVREKRRERKRREEKSIREDKKKKKKYLDVKEKKNRMYFTLLSF